MSEILNTIQVFNGWFATVLVTHSSLAIFSACFLAYIFCLIVWMQYKNPEFDILDVIYSYDHRVKKKSVATAKVILVGTFLSSTYYIIQHSSDSAFSYYLFAWVINGGVYSFSKAFTKVPEADKPKDGILK